MNLTKIFLESMPVDIRLPFGVINNVKLIEISNEERVDRKGQVIKKNCFVTFAQLDKDNKTIAESTFSYFNFEKPSYVKDNFTHQFIQLTEIVKYCMPKDKAEDILSKIEDYVDSNIKDYDRIFSKPIKEADVPFVTKTMSSFVNNIIKVIKKDLKDAELVQLMLGCDSKTGKFVDLPKEETGFLAHIGSKSPKLPTKYIKWRAKKDIPQKDSPDLVVDEAMVMDSDDLLADPEQIELDI